MELIGGRLIPGRLRIQLVGISLRLRTELAKTRLKPASVRLQPVNPRIRPMT